MKMLLGETDNFKNCERNKKKMMMGETEVSTWKRVTRNSQVHASKNFLRAAQCSLTQNYKRASHSFLFWGDNFFGKCSEFFVKQRETRNSQVNASKNFLRAAQCSLTQNCKRAPHSLFWRMRYFASARDIS